MGVFGFFTIATKLPSYVLPLMPAAAILVALLWSEELKVGKRQNFFLFQLSECRVSVGSGWGTLYSPTF